MQNPGLLLLGVNQTSDTPGSFAWQINGGKPQGEKAALQMETVGEMFIYAQNPITFHQC